MRREGRGLRGRSAGARAHGVPTINTPPSSLDLARSEASEGGAELRHATLMNNGKDITDKEEITIEQLWLSKQKTSYDEACPSCSG